ncbi:hypothetical protein [Gimesia sp.]|uniref:hypothetical protein n=1 Tax=Gimesia sp. TaxID=2024833 RepID=UPI0032F05497
MGMHVGLIATKSSVADFLKAFPRVFPHLEIVDAAGDFPDTDSIWEWKDTHEEFVPASDWRKDNPGKTVYLLWQDGPWTLLFDPSYLLPSANKELAVLSNEMGPVLSFVIDTTGGCAFFSCFENGELRREVIYNDATIQEQGTPLPQEAGIDMTQYYMDETEALWSAWGISPAERLASPLGCQAICVIDHTDYSDL